MTKPWSFTMVTRQAFPDADQNHRCLGIPFTAWTAFGDLMMEDLRERNRNLDGSDPPPERIALSKLTGLLNHASASPYQSSLKALALKRLTGHGLESHGAVII
jgi:hypothetical protein